MQQFISHRVLLVNGKPAPCKCDERKVCEYCIQANLVLWEREQHPEEEANKAILKAVEASGIRKTARLLKIQPSTVTRWIQTKKIPERYVERLKGVA